MEINIVNLYGRNRSSLYKAVVRNQYFVPELNDKSVTLNFLINTATGHFFVPKLQDIHCFKVCIDPPTKCQLAQMLHDAIEVYLGLPEGKAMDIARQAAFRRTAQHFKEYPPAKRYSVGFLSFMDSDNAIFAKGYKRPPRPSKVKDLPKMTLPISPDFFEGLPQLELSEIKGKRGLKLSK